MRFNRFTTQLSLVAISSTLIFFVYSLANLVFDPVHEGVNVASAVAINNGLIIHRDILEMKGLLFPYLISFLTGSNSLATIFEFKIVNIMLISISAILLYLYIRKINEILARLFVILWLLCNPAIANYTFGSSHGVIMLSPNNLTVTLILLILYLFSLSKQVNNRFFYSIILFFISILSGLLPWVRIQNIFFVLGIFFYLIFCQRRNIIQLFSILTLFITSLSLPLYYLNLRQAGREWFNQIVWNPWKLSKLQDSSVHISMETLTKTLSICLFFLFIFSILVKLSWKSNVFFRFSLMFALLSSPLALWMSRTYQIRQDLHLNPLNWLTILSNNWPNSWARALVLLTIFSVFYSLIKARKFLVKSIDQSREELVLNRYSFNHFEIPATLAGIQGILYLYPNFGNLWEMTPLLIISCSGLIRSFPSIQLNKFKSIVSTFVVGFVFSGIFNLYNISTQDKFYYSNSLLRDIYDTDRIKVQGIDRALVAIDKTRGTILNECGVALFAFRNGHFKANSPYYVNLSYRKVVTKISSEPEIVIRCSQEESNFDLSKFTPTESIEFSDGQFMTIYIKMRQ